MAITTLINDPQHAFLILSENLIDRIIIVYSPMDSNKRLKQPLISPPNSSPVSTQTSSFLSQIVILTAKNLLITFKNPKNIIFLIITPFILSLFLYAFQKLAVDNGNLVLPNPPEQPIPPFPKCGWSDCVSLDVRIVSDSKSVNINSFDWMNNIVKGIQATNVDVSVSNDVITSWQDLQNYYSYLQANSNRTQAGLLLCSNATNFPQSQNITNFCNSTHDYTYYLVLNKINSLAVVFHALLQPFPLDPVASALKLKIDNLIINYELNKKGTSSLIDYTTSQYPVGPNRYIQNYDIVTSIGAFYFMVTPLFVFLFLQSEIVREKEYRLRQGLNIFGAGHASYWISWFIIAVLYSLICSVSSFLAGLAFGFGFFTDTPFYIIIFFLLFPFCLSISMLAFFLSTLAPTVKAANATSYAIVLLAIVVQSFTSDNNLLTFIFTTEPSALVQGLKIFLLFYCPFSYTKIFTNITMYSGYHFDINQRSWVQGYAPYTIDVFTNSTSGRLPFGGGNFERYSDLTSMFILYADAAFFALLAWYCDNVVASNRGRGDSLFFPIHRLGKLLFKEKKKEKINFGMILKNRNLGVGEQESAIRQRNRVYLNSERGIPALGLRIKCLNKTFTTMCSKDQVHALNQLTIEIEPDELMGVLGHNGAGKTTLINILTGVLNPDQLPETEIIINRQSIVNIDEIRKHIGLCAQFDILWDELTAQQHLNLFAKLKGIPQPLIASKVKELLQMVSLGRQGQNIVKGFSGGMKRRLSLAIAAVGDPQIILLDEPTTGLDPKVRQQVWALIERLKKGRSIILTTHSMEEADVLADRVCVMVKGRIKCVGSPVSLKQQYGLGHRLTLNVDRSEIKTIIETLKKLCPSAVMVDYKGGNLVVGVSDFDNLLRLIRMLQSEQSMGLQEHNLKRAIRDWNVSHATLQQVFMSVSKQKE